MVERRIIVALGGAKGVGKTTIVSFLKQKRPFVRVFNYGLVLKELAESYYSQSFEQLPISIRNQLREKGAKHILKNLGSVNLIDLHFGEFEAGGYPSVLPNELLLQITHLVLVTGQLEKIRERRMKDLERRRLDECSLRLNVLGESLLFEQLAEKQRLKKIRISNNDKVDTVVEQLLSFLGI